LERPPISQTSDASTMRNLIIICGVVVVPLAGFSAKGSYRMEQAFAIPQSAPLPSVRESEKPQGLVATASCAAGFVYRSIADFPSCLLGGSQEIRSSPLTGDDISQYDKKPYILISKSGCRAFRGK
jgi:hypothetical protein